MNLPSAANLPMVNLGSSNKEETIDTGTRNLWYWYLGKLDSFFHWPFIKNMTPPFVRSFLRIDTLKRIDEEFLPNTFRNLDNNTHEDLRAKYAGELPYWYGRFKYMGSSMVDPIPVIFILLFAVFGLPLFCGGYGAYRIDNIHAWLGWWSILVFVGITIVTWMLIVQVTAILWNLRVRKTLKSYSDVLLVVSLVHTILATFSNSSNHLKEQRKEKIIRGIEESAEWIQRLESQLPLKDKVLRNWYRTQMRSVASDILTLRQSVIISKHADYELVRQRLLQYLDAALRKECISLAGEGVDLTTQKSPREIDKSASSLLSVISLVACIALVITSLESAQSLPIEAIIGTGGAGGALLIYRFLGGKQGIGDKKADMDALYSLTKMSKNSARNSSRG